MTPTPETVKRLCEAVRILTMDAHAVLYSVRNRIPLYCDCGVAMRMENSAESVIAALAAVEQEIQG